MTGYTLNTKFDFFGVDLNGQPVEVMRLCNERADGLPSDVTVRMNMFLVRLMRADRANERYIYCYPHELTPERDATRPAGVVVR